MFVKKRKPISLRVDWADSEPAIAPSEMQGYLWLAREPGKRRMAQCRLETIAYLSPARSLRMADVCVQQGDAELAERFNKIFCDKARHDPSFGPSDMRLCSLINSAMLKGGVKSTVRNELQRVNTEKPVATCPKKAREEVAEVLTYLEVALQDKPSLVLDYLSVMIGCNLLDTSAKMMVSRILERVVLSSESATGLPSTLRAKRFEILRSLQAPTPQSPDDKMQKENMKLPKTLRPRKGYQALA